MGTHYRPSLYTWASTLSSTPLYTDVHIIVHPSIHRRPHYHPPLYTQTSHYFPQKKLLQGRSIVAKKWEPGNLVPSRFSGQIRKVEARLGKLAKIRKVERD